MDYEITYVLPDGRQITIVSDTPPELKDDNYIELEDDKYYRIVKALDISDPRKPVYEVVEAD